MTRVLATQSRPLHRQVESLAPPPDTDDFNKGTSPGEPVLESKSTISISSRCSSHASTCTANTWLTCHATRDFEVLYDASDLSCLRTMMTRLVQFRSPGF